MKRIEKTKNSVKSELEVTIKVIVFKQSEIVFTVEVVDFKYKEMESAVKYVGLK